MSIFKDLKEGLKIVKAIKEVKEFLNGTHITLEVKEDIAIIKEAFDRLCKKIVAFAKIGEIIKKYF